MKVLVTGATGVYGRSVVERLHRAGHEVVAMARNPPKSLPPGVRFAQGDVADDVAVDTAMVGCDVVAHMAFVVSPLKSEEETRRINLGGTTNVLEAMKRTGARRLVFASSAMSYGANPDNPPLFTEQHEQRPAADYLYGTHKKEAERLIRDSGIEAVIARTAVTVGRNVDNLILDIFAAPAVVGIKGADIRWQLVHQDDVGRFLALACESGPPGPVNVAPADFLPLHEIAAILGKRYVEVSEQRLVRAVEFMFKHDLVDISPSEATGISYLPRLATDRLRDEWGFQCAWTTAEAVVDLRRALAGMVVVTKRRIDLPWKLRYPQHRPGDVVSEAVSSWHPDLPETPGELDTPVAVSHPTYRSATADRSPLTALTLTTHAHLLRAAASGVLDAFGAPEHRLGASAAAVFGHRLYVNDDLAAVAPTRLRRRLLVAGYPREISSLVAASAGTGMRVSDVSQQTDEQLDATLSALRDELAWLWAAAQVGAALEGDRIAFDALVTLLPAGRPLGATTPAAGTPLAAARAQAERAALAVSQALADAVRERARRLAALGVLANEAEVEHLTWDELLLPPVDAAAVIARRAAEHERLSRFAMPAVVSVTGPDSALSTRSPSREVAAVS